jgi:hypothetical protein
MRAANFDRGDILLCDSGVAIRSSLVSSTTLSDAILTTLVLVRSSSFLSLGEVLRCTNYVAVGSGSCLIGLNAFFSSRLFISFEGTSNDCVLGPVNFLVWSTTFDALFITGLVLSVSCATGEKPRIASLAGEANVALEGGVRSLEMKEGGLYFCLLLFLLSLLENSISEPGPASTIECRLSALNGSPTNEIALLLTDARTSFTSFVFESSRLLFA